MSAPDPRIDTYINKAAPFAQPVLRHIRRLVHKACPEVEETIKWGFPHFDYKGVMISMASFKAHCTLNFWKAGLIDGIRQVNEEDSAMGQFGRITSINDLPDDETLLGYMREAKRLNDEGIKLPQKPKEQSVKELTIPDCLVEALKENPLAADTWDKFAYSHKKEYVSWINDAKTEATRANRLATAIEWMAEGKPQNWKYARK
ncbi:MAG: YdeI/OmpD-associated family protein [Bacteroidales bacterium]|jgi:uncharacterized protein YdeI (YjbR/CyaY-like superfamily)